MSDLNNAIGSIGLNLPVSGGVGKAEAMPAKAVAPVEPKSSSGLTSPVVSSATQALGTEHKSSGPGVGSSMLSPRGSVGEGTPAKEGSVGLETLLDKMQNQDGSSKLKTYWDKSPYPMIDQEDILKDEQQKMRQEEIKKNPPSKAVPSA